MSGKRQTVDVFSDEFKDARLADLESRVRPKRLAHIKGVADTARMLADTYGVDPDKAYLAGLLHDWDKGYRNKEMRERAYALGVDRDIGAWVVENMPEVLHGPTAAKALSLEYPDIPDDVIHAIKVHTVGCLDMSPLDSVIYVADALEPHRDFEEAQYLRGLIGEVSLDELTYQVYKYWLHVLIEREEVMHPDTISIWNSLVEEKSKERKARFE